jgi:helicase MOV-10
MASWAQVARTRSATVARTDSRPVVKEDIVSHAGAPDAAVSNPTRSATSKLVAVPTVALPSRSAAIVAAASSSPNTAKTNSTSQTDANLNLLSKDRSPANAPSMHSTKDLTSPSSASVSWEYDVYATPFVPSEWRAINLEQPNCTMFTTSRHRLDYPGYVSTFAGTTFLPEASTLAREDFHGTHHLARLTAQSYLPYFTSLWQRELIAKEHECQEQCLYKVPLYRTTAPNKDSIWALSVPGLRSDSPFLEMGDVIQLRHLWIDGRGNISQTPILAEGLSHSTGQAVYYRGWTGVQYNASVYSINRKSEMVYLKVEGLVPHYAGYNEIPIMVNVTFTLKQPQIEVQRRALSLVDSELKKTVSQLLQSALRTDEGNFDDFSRILEARSALKASAKTDHTTQNDWTRRILFPTEEDGLLQTRLRTVPHRDLFDHAINYEQAHAVNAISTTDYGVLPYLISGPPGTGKTKTLVETAMQLLNTTQVAHILICAPSEAAADTLALRLKQYLSNSQLLRLNRPGRADNEVPRELTQYCYMTNDMFSLPPIKMMMSYDIVVTSCQDAGILLQARLCNNDLWHIERNMLATFHPKEDPQIPTLHWGALLIDEAAQATEIDLAAAISVTYPPSIYPTTNPQPIFVMAGDENQLGPRTSSHDPEFSTSLFARLFDRPLYRDHPLSRSHSKPSAGPPVLKKSMLPIIYPPFTNLIRNYRSHPSILSIPSSLFYNDTLIPEAPTQHTPLQASSLWRGRKWPVLFIPHTAPDEIERDGGGWYNFSEAQLACSLAQTLVEKSGVQQADICIMSPFAAQVKLLRSHIRSRMFGGGSGLWDVNIGPLEAFQGLEKRVVILCTTRTRERFLEEDKRRGLGIVHQSRKMNVALTRAKEALVVLGNPVILMHDEHWRQWLAFCGRNGLVSDPDRVWKTRKEAFGEAKVGVLERALVAKEESGKGKMGKMLGGAANTVDLDREYEVWMESLREAMDEEGVTGDEDEDEDEEADDDQNL